MIRYLILSFLVGVPACAVDAQTLCDDDRTRIVEARRLAAEFGDEVWPGWSKSPFAVLLVTRDTEFLIAHPTTFRSPSGQPSDDFTDAGWDELLQRNVYSRDRQFDTGLLATFPAVGGVPTIVIGQPEYTDASTSTRWTLTLLHEHFHQWQMSQPDYYPSTMELGLAGDDDSGMWMLNYPFPYDSLALNDAFSELCHRAADLIESFESKTFHRKLTAYLDARERWQKMLAPSDYTYYSFQLWQEGIPRYTEYRILRRASGGYEPTAAFKKLPDYTSYADEARRAYKHLITSLEQVSLRKDRRSSFYAIGAAEGLLLDKIYPGWQQQSFADMFDLGEYIESAKDY